MKHDWNSYFSLSLRVLPMSFNLKFCKNLCSSHLAPCGNKISHVLRLFWELISSLPVIYLFLAPILSYKKSIRHGVTFKPFIISHHLCVCVIISQCRSSEFVKWRFLADHFHTMNWLSCVESIKSYLCFKAKIKSHHIYEIFLPLFHSHVTTDAMALWP